MKKIKVLHFPVRNNKGGVTQYVLNNWKYIDKERFQFDFATMNSHLDFEDEVRLQECGVFYISAYAEKNREQFIKEIDAILDNGYDVVHLHTGLWKSFLVEERAKRKGIRKIIIHSHNTGIGGALSIKEYTQVYERHLQVINQLDESIATDFCACSWEAANWLYGNKIPNSRIKILTDAIELDKYYFNQSIRNEYRKRLGIEDNFVIGHVGRFAYQKNHEFLVEVFADAKKKIPKAKLLLIGIGELESEIKVLIRDKGISDSVIFLGGRGDVFNLFQAMDIFLLPSRYEGFGIALLEAQVAGLQCISSDVVPKQIELSNEIIFEKLEKANWVKDILYLYNHNHRVAPDPVKTDCYNIKKQVIELEEIYSSHNR